MKKLAIFATLLTLVLSGCAENTLDNIAPEEEQSTIILPDLTAGFADEEQTKTYVENGKYLRWHEADLITAFFGNTLNRQYKFKGKTGDNSGTFKLVPDGELGTGNELEAIYALYPYNEGATISDEGAISITLPAVQSYAENSFGRDANTMLAVTESVEDTFLGFKNACGYLKLKLYDSDGGELKSIEVRGNNGEKIAGAAIATIAFGEAPVLKMLDSATPTVTLDCGNGIAIGQTAETATEIWVVLPEITFTKGITIKVTDSEGGVFEKSTDKEVVITRNEIQPMRAVEAVLCAPESWKIRYTATKKVTPNAYSEFGANMVSNEWDEATGQGVITFDGEVTSIGSSAFSGCSSMTSVNIPDSVTSIGTYAFEDCSSLTSITIPDSVTSIEYAAFAYCTGELIINSKIVETDYIGFSYEEGVGQIIHYPSYYSWLTYNRFTKLSIGDNIERVGNYVFYDCNTIEEIILSNSITSIGTRAFENCSPNQIIIPLNVKSIEERAFANSRAENITISNGVISIGNGAFTGASISNVTIPGSVVKIEGNPFRDCTNLSEFNGKFASEDKLCLILDKKLHSFAIGKNVTEYTIPSLVTNVGKEAFMYGEILKCITIPDSVTSIEEYAFYGCEKLTNVFVGRNVSHIGKYAFQNIGTNTPNPTIISIYIQSIVPPMIDEEILSLYSWDETNIYVPLEVEELYKTSDWWDDYADYIIGYNFSE